MLTRKKLESKIVDSILAGLGTLSLIVTVVQLPTGAKEVITNYQNLNEKADYILNAYDDGLRLKICPTIRLLDCIIL